MLSNGEDVIAELPLEHYVMYSNYNRVGKIIRLGSSCLCCGKDAKHFLLIRDKSTPKGGRFALYTEDYIELTIDHIIPRFNGGKDKMSNYQVLCLFCNRTKGSTDMSIEDLRIKVKSIVANIVNSTTL